MGEAPLVVVIVTYGDRASFVAQALRSVDVPELVREVLVVDNAADGDIGELVRSLGLSVVTTVLTIAENAGSAGGFARGVADVVGRHVDGVVLLLDDDNVVDPGALSKLADAVRVSPTNVAWMLNRHSRTEIAALVSDGHPVRHTDNSYAGVSVRARLALMRRGRGARTVSPVLDYAPYGGLAIPIRVAARVGLPLADYFLYADDHEYSTRISRGGCPIVLLGSAGLSDVEPSWHRGVRTIVGSMDPDVDHARAYYSTRNRRHLERSLLTTCEPEVMLNAVAFWTAAMLDAVILVARGAPWARVIGRLRLLRVAVRDGRSGRLGPIGLHVPG